MGGQFGAKKLADGTGGTTPEALQQYLGACFVNESASPIMEGGYVTGRTDMRYDFTAGVGMLKTASGGQIITWGNGTTDLVTTPSAARTDVLWTNDFNGVHCSEGGVGVPANAIILSKKSLPAGATDTTGATEVFDRNWALPYGSNLGWLGRFDEMWSEGQYALTDSIVWCNVRFYVPTDRNIMVRILQSLKSEFADAQPDTTNRFGAMEYRIFLDGALQKTYEIEYSRTRDIRQRDINLWGVPAGAHTLRVDRKKKWGAPAIHVGGGVDNYQRGFCGVMDAGMAQ